MSEHSGQNTVLVDLDGVLLDFNGRAEAILAAERPDITKMPGGKSHFYFRDHFAPADQHVIHEITARPGFFLSLPPIDYAVEGWKRIKDLGHHPQICSSPLRSNKTCVQEKIASVKYYLGRQAAREAIITSDKNVDGFALIDDRPELKESERASWAHVVFDHPYNKYVQTDFRLRGWRDPNLKPLLASAQQRYIELGGSALKRW